MTVEFITADCLEWMAQQPADRFDLVFGSPPYCDARTYGIGAQRGCREWIAWMLDVTAAAARICRGPVIWVAAGVTRNRNYWPACEGLMWQWWDRGGDCELYRPCVFHRSGIPGSGGTDWFRSDWEYIMCFKRPGALAWADPTACGHPPKRDCGGWSHTRRNRNGELEVQHYVDPVLVTPGNVFRFGSGGNGSMGNRICHENEAPFPEALAEIFVRSLCPEGGWALDPFSGSGTTAAVCRRWGRNCVGVDVRASQTKLGRRRTAQRMLEDAQ